MAAEALLPFSVRAGEVLPHWLGPADHPWLRALLDERARFVGRRSADLDERLRLALPVPSPPGKRRFAISVLRSMCGAKPPRSNSKALSPRIVRERIFCAAAVDATGEREAILMRTAALLSVTPEALLEALYADLPGERALAPAPPELSPDSLALRANTTLAQSLLARASTVRITVDGNARALVSRARLRGLLCVVRSEGEVELSGPLALFRHTLVYGRALGGLVPALAWCGAFRLRAEVALRGGPALLRLCAGDPIAPSEEPRRYDSRLEERFAREIGRLAPDWDIVREPEPVVAGEALVFPDFALRHRGGPEPRWLVEIVGFWTPDYLARKLARYRAAALRHLILCIDEERRCAEGELPPGARVVWFRKRIDPRAVLAIIEGAAGQGGTELL